MNDVLTSSIQFDDVRSNFWFKNRENSSYSDKFFSMADRISRSFLEAIYLWFTRSSIISLWRSFWCESLRWIQIWSYSYFSIGSKTYVWNIFKPLKSKMCYTKVFQPFERNLVARDMSHIICVKNKFSCTRKISHKSKMFYFEDHLVVEAILQVFSYTVTINDVIIYDVTINDVIIFLTLRLMTS